MSALFWFSRTATRFSRHLTYSFFFRLHSFAASLESFGISGWLIRCKTYRFLSSLTWRFLFESSLSEREVRDAEPCRLAMFGAVSGLWLPPEFPYDKIPLCQSEHGTLNAKIKGIYRCCGRNWPRKWIGRSRLRVLNWEDRWRQVEGYRLKLGVVWCPVRAVEVEVAKGCRIRCVVGLGFETKEFGHQARILEIDFKTIN